MTNIDFCALVGFYQDREAGQRLHANLEEYRIRSYWIDSRVEDFPQLSENNLSTDGLREIIFNGKHSTLIDAPIPQRPGFYISKFFENCRQLGHNHVMVMGCDEYLTGDFDLLKSNLARLELKEPCKIRLPIIEHNPQHNNNLKHVAERIINYPQFVSISNVHWIYQHSMFGKKQIIEKSPLVLGMELHHDDRIRLPIRNKIMDIYQGKRRQYEQKETEKILKLRINKSLKEMENHAYELNQKAFQNLKP